MNRVDSWVGQIASGIVSVARVLGGARKREDIASLDVVVSDVKKLTKAIIPGYA